MRRALTDPITVALIALLSTIIAVYFQEDAVQIIICDQNKTKIECKGCGDE